MTDSASLRPRLAKLGLLAVLCALPFLVAVIVLERQVERIDTLPVDAYRNLVWAPDGRSLMLLHQSLEENAPVEVYIGEPSGEFQSLGKLPAGQQWRLTPQSVDDAAVLASESDAGERFAILENGAPSFLTLDSGWEELPSQGKGLFFAKTVADVPFDQMVQVEDAPEVAAPPASPEGEAGSASTTEAPTRSGVQIARYNRGSATADVLLTIPFNSPKERPQVQLVRESPDKRFVALITRFGDGGAAGLWVYDSEASRLLWTRVMTTGQVTGVDWSPKSQALALCDDQGVVILDNVMNVESTRFEAQGLGAVAPLFVEENTLYLVGKQAVHRLDRQGGQAVPIFDAHARGVEATEFVVNPSASKAAFFTPGPAGLQLEVADLENKEEAPAISQLPGSLRRRAQGSLSYQVGSALRTAWKFWTP